MSKNEFDDLLLRKLQEEDFPYKKANWERLARLLPPEDDFSGAGFKNGKTRVKTLRIAIGVAAGIAVLLTLLVATGIFRAEEMQKTIPLAGRSEKQAQEPARHADGTPGFDPNKPVKKQTDTGQPQGDALLAETGRNNLPPKTASGKSPTSASGQDLDPETLLLPSPAGTRRPGAITEAPPAALAKAPAAESRVRSGQVESEQPGAAETARSTSPGRVTEALAQEWSDQDKKNYYNSLRNPLKEQEEATARTTVSVGGGVNYGSLNTGYALGLSARQKIGERFFVEGSVGMLYNNNARNVADYNTLSGFSAAARPSGANAMMLNSPAISPVENLYYFQVNPAVGYEINEQFAFSVGGDLQHLITATESPKVQYSAEEVRIFPVLDVGLTGKTEFSISPEIQAGILYREGLSAWLKSDPGTSYLNRRYIQVQFKYSLPVGK